MSLPRAHRRPYSMTAVMRAARRWRWTLVAVVSLVVASTVPLLLRLRIDADVLNLLPQSGPALRSFRTYLSEFGSLDRVYVVFEAPDGQSIADYAPLVDRYAAGLERAPEISHVDAQLFAPGKDWDYLGERVFLLLGAEATKQALGRLQGDRVLDQLAQARERLALSSPAIKQLVQQDPFDFFGLLRGRLSAANAFVQIDPTQEGYVSKDGKARLVIASPTRPPYDTDFSRRVVQRLDRIAADVLAESAAHPDETDLPPLRIDYAGGYHIALGAERTVRREAVVNLVGSLAGILLLLLVVFRSPWLFLVGAIPMALGGLLSAALNGLFDNRLSAAAAGASALLFGLGIDGVVLLYARYLEERSTTAEPGEAIARLGGSAASMLLGMTTSAATFLALTFVEFPSLQELGRLIGMGMLFGGLFTLVLVPALLPANVRRRRALSLQRLPRFVSRRGSLVLWGGGIATILLGTAALGLHVDLSLQRLQPRTPQIAFEREVARRFGLPEDVVIVLAKGKNLEALLQTDEKLREAVDASGTGLQVFSVTSMLPPMARQAQVSEAITEGGISTAALRMRIARAAKRLGFRPDAFTPFLRRVPHLLDTSARVTYEGFLQHGLEDLLSPYIARTSKGFVTAAYVRPRSNTDVAALRHLVEDMGRAGSALTVTGATIVSEEFGRRLLPQFTIGVAIGAVVVFVLMLWIFKSVPLTALALLPTGLGLIWSAGLLALLRVELDLFSLFGVLTFIGIGVDYGIHLVHRYAAEEELANALARIAPVNLVAGGIAVLGCGTLITSSYPPLRSLGIVSVVTLITCLAGSLLVLPACLAMLRRPSQTRE
jgi:uncharacterized protein